MPPGRNSDPERCSWCSLELHFVMGVMHLFSKKKRAIALGVELVAAATFFSWATIRLSSPKLTTTLLFFFDFICDSSVIIWREFDM